MAQKNWRHYVVKLNLVDTTPGEVPEAFQPRPGQSAPKEAQESFLAKPGKRPEAPSQ